MEEGLHKVDEEVVEQGEPIPEQEEVVADRLRSPVKI